MKEAYSKPELEIVELNCRYSSNNNQRRKRLI